MRTNGKIVNQIDLKQIQARADRYRNFSEFHEDIQWFVHNCMIMYASDAEVQEAAKSLPEFIDEEITSVMECIECYKSAFEDPINSFPEPCKTKHPVVWAKSGGFNYWPAKQMKIQDEKVNVRYFGDHSFDIIPLESCCDFSLKCPSKINPKDSLFHAALKVCTQEIDYSDHKRV